MYERLKRLYNDGKIDKAGLQYWVNKGVLTQEQMNSIIQDNK